MAKGVKTGGRKKGTPNKMTGALKEMILQALDEQPGGGIGYLKLQAQENPNAFMSLLGRVLPMQVTGEDGGAIKSESKWTVEFINATPEGKSKA